jgi:hypothetical protein
MLNWSPKTPIVWQKSWFDTRDNQEMYVRKQWKGVKFGGHRGTLQAEYFIASDQPEFVADVFLCSSAFLGS